MGGRRGPYVPPAFVPRPSMPSGGWEPVQRTGVMYQQEEVKNWKEFDVGATKRRKRYPPPREPSNRDRSSAASVPRDEYGQEGALRRMPLVDYMSHSLAPPIPDDSIPQEMKPLKMDAAPTPTTLRQGLKDRRQARAERWRTLLRDVLTEAHQGSVTNTPPDAEVGAGVGTAVLRSCTAIEVLPGGRLLSFDNPPPGDGAGDWLLFPTVSRGAMLPGAEQLAMRLGLPRDSVSLHDFTSDRIPRCEALRLLALRGVNERRVRQEFARPDLRSAMELGPSVSTSAPPPAPTGFAVTLLLGKAEWSGDESTVVSALETNQGIARFPAVVRNALVPGRVAAMAVGKVLEDEGAAEAALCELLLASSDGLRQLMRQHPGYWTKAALQALPRTPGAAALACLSACDFDSVEACRELQSAKAPLLPLAEAVAAVVWEVAAE
eukprot:Hpha_TRINITY_DN3209_c0_g2::TRINITY_DN3209_c0_g2_i1::g.186020::m.186020